MLPFPQQSSSDANLADTSSPTGTDSPGGPAAHKKPSLRILDEGPNSREEDLIRGPLLRDMGIATHEDGTIHSDPEMGPELVLESWGPPEARLGTILPSIPSSLPNAPGLPTMSQSGFSDTGGTFSLLTDRPSSPNFSHHQVTGSEGQMEQPTSYNGALALLPFKYEFSWENSRLVFGGEPFEAVQEAKARSAQATPNSSIASPMRSVRHPDTEASQFDNHEFQHFVTAGSWLDELGSAQVWAALHAARDLEVASGTCSVRSTSSSSGSMSDEDPGALEIESTQSFIARERTIDQMVQLLLDDYLRSYTPQKSKTRSSMTRNQEVRHTDSDSHRIIRSGNSKKQASKTRRRQAPIDGSGESEDDDDDSRQPWGPSSTRRSGSSHRFACPYIKWKPERYSGTCSLKHKTPSHVKNHLIKKHYNKQCPSCYYPFPKGEATDHYCSPRPAPVGFITYDMLKEIMKQADKKKSHEQQWQRLYSILFPHEPLPLSPFLAPTTSESVEIAEGYLRSERSRLLLQRELEDSGYKGAAAAEIKDVVLDMWLPKAVSMSALVAEAHSPRDTLGQVADDNDQTAGPFDSSQALVHDAMDAAIPHDTGSHALQHLQDPFATIQASPGLGLDDHFSPMLGTFGNQPSMETVDGWHSTDLTGLEGPGFPGPEADMWDVRIDSLGLPTDFEFSNSDEVNSLFSAEGETNETRNADACVAWNI